MSNVPSEIQTWQMVQPWKKNKETGEKTPGKLEKTTIPVPELQDGEALVEIAGCGVCHTDLGYFYGGVPTVNEPPLTLGHEISGVVVAGDEKLLGKEVEYVQIVGQDHPAFGYGLFDDFVVAQSLQSLVAQVDSVTPPSPQKGHRAGCQSHIG